jgi:hypothetical protein
MDKEKATAFVIRELARHHSRDRILMDLCERGGMNYREAQQLMQEVESNHGRMIAQRQSPFIIVFGVTLIIVGIALTIYNGMYFLEYFQAEHNHTSALEVLSEAAGLQTFYYRVGALLTGLGLIVGGIIGSWQMVEKLLKE